MLFIEYFWFLMCFLNVLFLWKFCVWGLKEMFFVIGGRWVGGSLRVGFKLCFLLFKLKWFGGGFESGCLLWFLLLIVRKCCCVFFLVCSLFCRLLFVFCNFCKENVIDFFFICFCLKLIVDDLIVGFDLMFLLLKLLFFCFWVFFRSVLYMFFKDKWDLSWGVVFFLEFKELDFVRFNDVFCSI